MQDPKTLFLDQHSTAKSIRIDHRGNSPDTEAMVFFENNLPLFLVASCDEVLIRIDEGRIVTLTDLVDCWEKSE